VEFAKQKAALAQRERILERSLADAERSAAEATARIEAREAALATQEAGLQQQESELADRHRSVVERERKLIRARAVVTAREEGLGAVGADLKARTDPVAADHGASRKRVRAPARKSRRWGHDAHPS
jgi:chromosome segregation ATPase